MKSSSAEDIPDVSLFDSFIRRSEMRLRFRVTIRWLILAVALVGLAIGLAVEWSNRSKRNQAATMEARSLRLLKTHEKELAFCLQHANEPYDLSRANSSGRDFGDPFKSWSDEAEFHAMIIDNMRELAIRYAIEKDHYQRRSLFP
jgi:hypothetical protein